jgi:hypothetical protein
MGQTHKVTRRSVLKAGVLGAPLLLLRIAHADAEPAEIPTATPEPKIRDSKLQPLGYRFGRVFHDGAVVREQASAKAVPLRRLSANEVIPLFGQVVGEGPWAYNPFWYLTTDGYVHSSNVQPCNRVLNQPLAEVGKDGLWSEVTVPLTEVRATANPTASVRHIVYYGCTFRILRVVEGSDGRPWYLIADGNAGNYGLGYVRAEHLRPLGPEDFAPISPDVPPEHKRIEVDLKAQTVTAYEYDRPVFTARTATGGQFRTPEGVRSFATNRGEFRIFRKNAGTRMTGGTRGYDYYDLPGVSWASYFTGSGIAFHGTYWHNDYGRPRSHGCVNLLPEQAKWVFRWTTPAYPHTLRTHLVTRREEGSLVRVF